MTELKIGYHTGTLTLSFPELFTPEMVNFEADVWRIQSSCASKQAIQNKMSD